MNPNQFNEQLLYIFSIEMNHKDRGGAYGVTQRLMAYNSNKIEGSTLTPDETASLFETGTVTGETFRAKDIEEMTGHFIMFNYMINTIKLPLTEELIKKFHFFLKSGVFEDHANGYIPGEYKSRRNTVNNIDTALPEEVPARIKKLLSSYNSSYGSSYRDLKAIAKFHADFEHIHPFQDGNGRVGRMILFRECLRNNQVPVIILDDTKAQYYKSLKKAQISESYSDLMDYFKQCQECYLEKITPYISPNHFFDIEKE